MLAVPLLAGTLEDTEDLPQMVGITQYNLRHVKHIITARDHVITSSSGSCDHMVRLI